MNNEMKKETVAEDMEGAEGKQLGNVISIDERKVQARSSHFLNNQKLGT